MKSTNYYNTLIEIADDCLEKKGSAPTSKNVRAVAQIQFEILFDHAYEFTSDDVLFRTFVERKNVSESTEEKERFFSKGQPCFRASPLPKRYGWGVHADNEGKICLISCSSSRYKELQSDDSVKKIKAMRSKRA